MVHTFLIVRRRHYGTGSSWELRTTEAVRRAMQHSQESLRTLARRRGVNPKTVAKWRKRTSVVDRRTGPAPKSTVVYDSFPSTGSCCRCFSPAYAAAARRLPVCVAGHDPGVDPIVAAPLPTAARYFQTSRRGRRPSQAQEVQVLSDRLLPYRCRGGAYGAR